MSKKLLFNNINEWLTYKEDKISASVVGAIIGVNKYESPFQLWEVYTKRAEKIKTKSMQRGFYFEKGVKLIFQEDNDIEFLRDDTKILVYEHDDYPYISVTPDEEVIFNGEEMLMEIKTTKMKFTPDTIPAYYYAQVQLQLGVSGYDKCLFVWWDLLRDDYDYCIIEFDKEYYDLEIDAIKSFKYHIDTDTPPIAVSDYDFDSMKAIPNSITSSDLLVEYISKIQYYNNIIKSNTEIVDALKLKIKQYLGNNESLVHNNKVVATYKNYEKVSFDKDVISKYPNVYKEAIKISNSRVLKINYNKM